MQGGKEWDKVKAKTKEEGPGGEKKKKKKKKHYEIA